MRQKKRWVVEGSLEGRIYVPETDSNLPIASGKVALTRYALLEQEWPRGRRRNFFLGLEIPIDADSVCVAFQEMEAFVRALAIEKDVPISAEILRMTDKAEEWPQGIEFLEARDFSLCSRKWEPVDHNRDPKNRVSMGGRISGLTPVANLGIALERRHQAFSAHDSYRSALVKDYLAGLDAHESHPSLAMLYYFKILERVGKHEYKNPQKGSMTQETMDAIITELRPQLSQVDKARARDVLRWRHRKSEAHLVTEGEPTSDELRLCRKMAYGLIQNRAETRGQHKERNARGAY